MCKKRELFWKAAVFVLTAIYFGVFMYLNLAKWMDHVDSDIAAEALLAREIWDQKTLTPDNWIASTARYIVGMPTLAAIFYGITGSMSLATGIACVIIGAAVAVVLFRFLRKIGLSTLASLTALLTLLAVPVNGLRNEGQMVPFVTLLLFLFADYYALHTILMLFNIPLYLRMKKGKPGRTELFAWVFLFGFTTVLTMESQRCFQMIILPMAVVEVVSLFVESEFFTKKPEKSRYFATGYVGTMILAFLIAGMYKGQADYGVSLLNPKEIMERIFITIPASILEGFGVAGNAVLGSFASLMQVLVWAFLILVGFGLYLTKKKKDDIPDMQRGAVGIFAASVGITAFIIAFTSAEPAHNYLMFSWFVAIITVGILVDWFGKRSWFVHVILAAICVFAVLNLKYTYVDSMTTTDNLEEYEEVADYMIKENVRYGYAEFWDASRISMVRDGKVTMGHSYVMEDLDMYWWLTCTDWYPPNLPNKMRTGYVVRKHKKEQFMKQFENPSDVKLGFENDTFAVYISDTNYVNMP